MATIEQSPPAQEAQVDLSSPLNNLLARAYAINWEMLFYIGIFTLAVLTRFLNLGDRVASHDESLHMQYSWTLWKKGEYIHTPLMHGPVLFHMTALMYFLFGVSDFTARLYPAILGVIMVLMPKLLFERWLGKRGAMTTSILLLISPMILYHHRYIREDTPSLFFTLIMVYAVFAYLDGVRPKQTKFLIIFSGAMLLSLASKEVAFMYIAIFGLILTMFWLFQVAQGVRSGMTHPIVGQVIAGVLAVIAIGVGSLLGGSYISDKLTEAGGAELSGRVLAVPIAIVLIVIALVLYRPARNILGALSLHGQSLFKLVLAGIIIGTIAALCLTAFLSIIPTADIWKVTPAAAVAPDQNAAPAAAPAVTVDQVLLNRLIIWVTLLALVLALVVIGTALIRFAKSPRLPWADILIVALVAVIACTALVVVEERSKHVPNLSVERPKDAAPLTSERHNEWLVATWAVGIVAVGLLVALRYTTPFFEEMKRYPVFDILIVMGTLILPWLAAIPIFLAGYPLDDSNLSSDTINACIAGAIPFIVVSVVAGALWNWRVWLACAATFYSIFIFFFTTIFTNINGMWTGLVGSLGYWLVQQGVRRGSQPQYYYFLEMGIYEYLPVIGSIVAGIVGMLGVWRFRAERMAEADALARQTPYEGEIESTEMSADSSTEDRPYSAEVTMVNAVNSTSIFDGLSPSGADPGEADNPEAVPIPEVDPEEMYRRARSVIHEAEWIDQMPFLGFVGIWAGLIFMAFTMAGEKMPWLSTHLTVPLIFACGWYLGTLVEKLDWSAFLKRAWVLVILIPILVIALVNVFGPFLFGNAPFRGLERDELSRTFTWMGAIMLTGVVGYAIYRIWKQIGTSQLFRVAVLGCFILLMVLTARVAWMAAYINYDYATEFLVYAHASPNYRTVMNTIDDIGKRTADGLNVRVAYDNLVSWPGSWYFRDFPPGTFKGDMGGVTDLDTYLAVVVGEGNNSKIESQLADKFYKVRYSRMWWPMQDYFDLNVGRIDNVFSGMFGNEGDLPAGWVKGAPLREGLWDIWWNHDYVAYGKATSKEFDVSKWPVTDWMYFYVRKDIAAQIWDFGTGAFKLTTIPDDPFKALRCETCGADLAIANPGDQAGQLNHPRGVSVGPDGNVYVADSQNARISIFGPDGNFINQFGAASNTDQITPPGGLFREPWGVAVGPDNNVYVADTWNHRVQVFDKQGQFLRTWGQFEQVPPNQTGKPDGFWGPRDIAVDDEGQVYVADTGNKRIRIFDSQGKFLRDIGRPGAGAGQLDEPVGIALNLETNEIYIADTWNKRIDVFDIAGPYRRSWTVQAWGATRDSGSRPFLAFDKSATHLFVTDPDAGRILVFDINGNPLASFGSLAPAGTNNLTQFGVLGGITADKQGRMFFVDSANGRVLRFAPEAIPQLLPPPITSNVVPDQPTGELATQEVF